MGCGSEVKNEEGVEYVRVKADNSAQVTIHITVNRYLIEWRALKWVVAYIKDRKKMPSTMISVFTQFY